MTVNTGLAASRRHQTGKGAARRLRAAGQVPAVLYGKDQESVSLTLDAQEALSLFHSISVENTIVNVQIDDDKEELETLVREIQMHPYPTGHRARGLLLHRTGRGPRGRDSGQLQTARPVESVMVVSLEVILHEFRVKCLPSKIPESIEIEISHLDIGDSIHASEISMEEGVELLTDPGQTICLVSAPRAEEEVEVEEELEEGEEGIEGEEGCRGRGSGGWCSGSGRRLGRLISSRGSRRESCGRAREPRAPLRRHAPQCRLVGRRPARV